MSMAATEIERGEVDKLPHVPGVDAAKLSLTAPKCMETQEKGEMWPTRNIRTIPKRSSEGKRNRTRMPKEKVNNRRRRKRARMV